MTDSILYGAACAFVLLLTYFVLHVAGTRRLESRMRADELGPMCPRCAVGSVRPPQLVCRACLDMEPRLRLVPGTGGEKTSAAVRP